MTIYLKLSYNTIYGEELLVNIIRPDSAQGVKQETYRMSTHNGKEWFCNLDDFDAHGEQYIDFFYSVLDGSSEQRHEWTTETHRIDFTARKAKTYIINSIWEDIPEDSYLYSSAFTQCVNRRKQEPVQHTDFNRTLRIIARAPQLRSGERLAISGSCPILGGWNPAKAVPMYEHNHNEWVADIDAATLDCGKNEYKFVAINDNSGDILWETGYNRCISTEGIDDGELCASEIGYAFFEICNTKMAGTLIPVFSLRSEKSFGVGDFGDLKMMVDWIAKTNQKVLQVLPINDTTTTKTWTDSYPYSCISIFALHPQYADLTQLPPIADVNKRAKMEALRKDLNALKQIDYERVNNAKTEYLQIIFRQEGKKTLNTADFKRFFDENSHWLVPYARYCELRDKFGTADFTKWTGHEKWCEEERHALSDPRSEAYKQASFYYYVQYVLSRQMEAVHEYAVSRGVILKGDIPIGVNRRGCDVWHEPGYFNLDGQAGAPPDAFSTNGQNWGFPTYNWERMLQDGCQWWVRRFQNMSKFFDAYRIDHVLGFFRIWEIPISSVHGLLGQFVPALGMSREEIEAYGLKFQEKLFTEPFIADWVLDRIFREHKQYVKDTYLDHAHDDIFRLKPAYDTQRKIEAAFAGRTSEQDKWIRDGLYALVSDVLFVRDHRDKNKFHPRISAQFDFMYEALYGNDKAAFNRLYNDYYYRRNNYFWYREAMKKLPLLVQATRMLVCAEDLGMVPDCVPWVLEQLRILSLEVQSMPKDPATRFANLSKYPYRSVCTFSSHDMPTLRQWWDEDNERTQDYYTSMLYHTGNAPHPLPGWLAEDIIARQLMSPSMLCILSLQDWLAMDERLRLPDANAERINIPSNPHHYWRYRMHISIEQLMKEKEYNDNIKELINQSGRK